MICGGRLWDEIFGLAPRTAPRRARGQPLALPGATVFIPHFPSIVDIQCGEKAILL